MTNTVNKKSYIRIRMDDDLKIQTNALLSQMGLSMATAVTMLAKRIVAEGKLPFEPMVCPQSPVTPSEVTKRAMMKGRSIIGDTQRRFAQSDK